MFQDYQSQAKLWDGRPFSNDKFPSKGNSLSLAQEYHCIDEENGEICPYTKASTRIHQSDSLCSLLNIKEGFYDYTITRAHCNTSRTVGLFCQHSPSTVMEQLFNHV